MQRVDARIAVVLLAAAAAAGVMAGAAVPPSPPALVAAAPRLASGGGNPVSFEVRCRLILNNAPFEFLVSYDPAHPVALQLRDTRDGAPMLVAADEKFVFYDPIGAEVLMGSGEPVVSIAIEHAETAGEEAGAGRDAEESGTSFAVGLGLRAAGDPDVPGTNVSPAATIDLHSILESLTDDLALEQRGEGSFVLTGRSRTGGRGVAFLDIVDGRPVYRRVELFGRGEEGGRLFCVIDEIQVGVPLPEERFTFPSERLAASGLPLRPLRTGTALRTVLSIGRFVRGVMARLALAGAEDLRPVVETMAMRELDWESLRATDATVSARLKEIFGASSNGSAVRE